MKIRTDCFYHQGSVLTVGLLQKLPACIEILRDYSPVLWKSWSEEIPRIHCRVDDDSKLERGKPFLELRHKFEGPRSLSRVSGFEDMMSR